MKGNKYNYRLPNIDILKNHYFDELLSASDIAHKYGVTTGAVLIKFRRYDIKRRTLSESQKLKANYIELNNDIKDFINGLLLGDGSLIYAPNKKSCTYSHSDKNEEYLKWLKVQLETLRIKCSTIKPHTNNSWCLKTLWYRDFVELRHRWYPKGKKKIPKLKLTPIVLFNWYIGDGSYDSKSDSEKIVICSEFDNNGKSYINDLMNKTGIKTSIYSNAIYIKKESWNSFFKYILNHKYTIPECYKYKFTKEVLNGLK